MFSITSSKILTFVVSSIFVSTIGLGLVAFNNSAVTKNIDLKSNPFQNSSSLSSNNSSDENASLEISKPVVEIPQTSQDLAVSNQEETVSAGEVLNTDIVFLNTVATPKNSSRCIITLSGNSYDVTSLRSTHSGGDVFSCGTDMTAKYQGRHGTNLAMMQGYLVSAGSNGGGSGTISQPNTPISNPTKNDRKNDSDRHENKNRDNDKHDNKDNDNDDNERDGDDD